MTDDLQARIGRRLRAVRESRGLTQEDVAAAIERSVETVSNIERGRTLATLDTLDRLTRQLGIPLAEFLDEPPVGAPVSPGRAALDMRIRELLRGFTDLEAEVALRQMEALPLLRPGLLSGGIMAFVISFDNVTISLFLSAPGATTLPALLFNQAAESGLSTTLAAVCAMLVLFMLALMLVVERVLGLERFATGTVGR